MVKNLLPYVIPAEAGIQWVAIVLDFRFCRNDKLKLLHKSIFMVRACTPKCVTARRRGWSIGHEWN
jgi:hypothetical protein